MSYCKKEGKDQIIFVTKEDHETSPKLKIEEDDDDESPGIILPNGEINWNCPCLGGMATGPCGVEFREAFSCFQYSTATPKGSDCFDQFHTMQDCMTKFPALYPQADPLDMSEEDDEESGGRSRETSESIPNIDKTDKSSDKQDSAKTDSKAETSKSK